MTDKHRHAEDLPDCAVNYIRSVLKRVRNTRRVRREVFQELADHFADALRDCANEEERAKLAAELARSFGDPKVLGRLIRRGKKRCRPLWKMALIRSAQALGIGVIALCLYTWWFVSGQPIVRTDYFAKLNQMGRPEVPQQENAWENYRRAIELYVEPPPERGGPIENVVRVGYAPKMLGDLSERQRAIIEKALQDNRSALAELVAGSRKQHCWVEYEGEGMLLALRLPPLGKMRPLAKLAIWRARMHAERGAVDRALGECLTVVRVGNHWQRSNGTLIEQLVGIVISRLGHQEILRLIDSGQLPAEELTRAQSELASMYAGGYPLLNIESERLYLLDAVQHCFTDGGPGGGHLIPDRLRALESDSRDYAVAVLRAMVSAGRDETLSKGNDYYRMQEEAVRLTPYARDREQVNEQVDEFLRDPATTWRFPLLKALLPSLSRAGELGYRAKALHEATLTILGLQRWRLEKGRYPEGLAELVADGFLESVPSDPYSNGPLRYKPTSDGFMLYSVGGDFRDDAGARARERGRPWDANPGDTVYWPVGKLTLGPLIERDVNDATTGENCALDLDNAEVFSLPAHVDWRDRSQTETWAPKHGIDLIVVADINKRLPFRQIGTQIFELRRDFDEAEAWDVSKALGGRWRFSAWPVGPAPLTEMKMDAPPIILQCAFSTREGGEGVLEIRQDEVEPKAFIVRYRMLRDPAVGEARTPK